MWRWLRRGGTLVLLRLLHSLLSLTGQLKPYGILTIDLSGDLAEESGEHRMFGFLRRSGTDYLSVITVLRWARDDPRLSAVLIRCDELHANWARVQGLRRAIQRLRDAGKHVWVHLNSAGVHEYYLASAAERISLPPAATLSITGLSSEATFFLAALQKVGIEADIIQMGRYKTFGESFTRRDMSPPHREMMESLVDDLYGQLVDGIASGRGLQPGAVRDTLDQGPFIAQEALAARLVDATAYSDEVEAQLIERCGGAVVIDHTPYMKRRRRDVYQQVVREGRGALAILHINGTIRSGESLSGPGMTNATGSRSIADALKEIRERDDVRAVIVRVSSPGGSAVASDLIWREIVRTREMKPVVVSCGDVAASGGYYVALGGTPVLAEPATITGSIGVIAGKANLRGLYERIGVSKELVTRGRHAALFSDYVPLSDEERARIRAEAESFYERFVQKVADARRLSREAVVAAAEGRVWTGRQAWTRGLIDELGGVEEALNTAKAMIGIPADGAIAVERFPRPRRRWKLSVDLNLPNQGRLFETISVLAGFRFLIRERIWALMPFNVRFF